MSDSLFDYPDVKLKTSIQPEQPGERKVIITYGKAKKSEFFYNKATFDYNLMFMDINGQQSEQNAEDFSNLSINLVTEKKKPQLSLSIRVEEKIEKSDHEQKILEGLIEEQNNYQKEPVVEVNQKVQQKEKASSLWVNSQQLQQPSRKQQEEKCSRRQEKSQIEGLSQQFKDHQCSKSDPMLDISHSADKQKSNSQFDLSRKCFQEGISSILVNQSQENLQRLLNRFNEIDSDLDEAEINQNLQLIMENELRRESKIKQMESLPWKKLIYKLKTEKCSRVCLKSIKDFDDSILKVKKPNSYFSLANQKIIIPSPETDGFIWHVGRSKIKLIPLQFALDCFRCSTRTRTHITDLFCSAMCINPDCGMLMSVQILQIGLIDQSE